MPQKEKLVILGGGFAGLNVLKYTDKERFEVHIVDRNNYHGFPPLFYQVASSGLEPTDIAFPFRRRLGKTRDLDARFHLGVIREVDPKAKVVRTDKEEITYDRLVVALGTTNNFFGDPTLIERVFTLKSIDEAIRLRNEIIYRCEQAALEHDEAKRRRMLTFVVVGGGPAGVEVAGALGELKRYILKREYPEINPDEMTIRLIEGTDRLLATMSAEASASALEGIKKLMVDVTLGHVMKSYENDIVTLDDGSEIESSLVVWTAGVKATPITFVGEDPAKIFVKGGRLLTDDRLRVAGLDGVYAIGDVGLFTNEAVPRGLPQLAQVAIQEGKYIARCMNKDEWDKPFRYHDKGSMATIGRNRAVADLGHTHLSGFIGWLAWMFVHLVSLMGMRSKLSVLLNWVWSYFTYNTSLRMLLHGSRYPKRKE